MTDLTRRSWIKGTAAAGVLVACGGRTGLRVPDTVTSWVVEVDAFGATVVGWSDQGLAMTAELRLLNETLVESKPLAGPSAAWVRFTALTPGTAYRAVVTSTGGVEANATSVNLFVTAPDELDARTVRIAVSGDATTHPDHRSGIYDVLAAQAVDLYVSLGDFPYADTGGASTTGEFRQNYVDLLTDPALQSVLRGTSIRAIYDDHEVINNWDGATAPSLVATGTAVWHEFYPTDEDVTFRRWRWGANVECFMLDCRRSRSANDDADDTNHTMLGAAQRDWLIAAVTTSAATFKLIFTSVPFDFGNGRDHWKGYAIEREAILAALAGTSGVLFLSADQHWFGANLHGHNAHEFQVGPLAAKFFDPPETSPALTIPHVFNFGLLEIGAETLRFVALGPDGETLHDATFTAAELALT